MNDDAEAVLAVAADLALATGTRMVEPAAAEAGVDRGHGLDHGRFFAAAGELRDRGLIQLATAPPTQVVLIALTNAGLLRHLAANRPDLDDVRRRVAGGAAAAAGHGTVPLAEQLGEPPLLVECLLDELVSQRRLVYSKAPGRKFRVHRVF